MRIRFAAGLLLFTLTAHAAEPMQLLIFSGGKTEADAKRALASYERLKAVLARAVVLAPGQPQIVESAKLPGLTAGFWVVTLGRCHAPADALQAIKAVYPGTYAKPLTGDAGAEACPVLKGETVSALDPTLRVGDRVVRGFALEETSKDRQGNESSSTQYEFVLTDKASGEVLAITETPGGGTTGAGSEGPTGAETQTCSAAVRLAKGSLVVSRTCTSQRTSCNYQEREIPTAWTETQRVTVAGDHLSVSRADTIVTASSTCSAENSSEGD